MSESREVRDKHTLNKQLTKHYQFLMKEHITNHLIVLVVTSNSNFVTSNSTENITRKAQTGKL